LDQIGTETEQCKVVCSADEGVPARVDQERVRDTTQALDAIEETPS
jgi:hypothetical protein